MAADTASKRASAIATFGFFVLAQPWPDGTIDQGDSQQTTHVYSGVLAQDAFSTPSRRNYTPPTRANNADPQGMRNHTPSAQTRGDVP